MSEQAGYATTHATGGCQCGAVRYRVTEPLGACGVCHCRMCQRATGNAFAPLVTARGVIWEGVPGRYASSNISERGFCRDCGTPLFMQDFGSDEYELMTGTLDDPEAAPPDHVCGTEGRLGWVAALAALPEETTAENNPAAQEIRSLQYQAAEAAKEER